jgi:hypothetical protein
MPRQVRNKVDLAHGGGEVPGDNGQGHEPPAPSMTEQPPAAQVEMPVTDWGGRPDLPAVEPEKAPQAESGGAPPLEEVPPVKRRRRRRPTPPLPPDPNGGKMDLEELEALKQAAGPVGSLVMDGMQGTVLMTPEELEVILAPAFQSLATAGLKMMKRQGVTEDEAKRWAKVTRMVYGRYLLQQTQIGPLVHLAVTASILLSKPKLAEAVPNA